MDTKIHQKSHTIVSVLLWVSNGTFWHQKVVPEGGSRPQNRQKNSKKHPSGYVSKKLWKWRSYDVVLPRSVLRALKIARFLFEPELQENRTDLPKNHNHNHRHGPETQKRIASVSPWDVATFGVLSLIHI